MVPVQEQLHQGRPRVRLTRRPGPDPVALTGALAARTRERPWGSRPDRLGPMNPQAPAPPAERESASADLSACATEPIHIPGAIQPHGCLLVADASGVVSQASANAQQFLGLLQSPLGQPLRAVLGPVVEEIQQGRQDRDDGAEFALGDRRLWLTPHRNGPLTLVELEPAGDAVDAQQVQLALRRLAASTQQERLLQHAAEAVRLLTGFDRVIVYRFDDDGHGSVIAETRPLAMEPYLGLHYPESDIPRQARALYLRNWIRCIPDAGYRPVPIEPTLRPDTRQALDLSEVLLRSVSPVHLEYLHNMGVRASMSISLIVEGRLWGLISCGHRTPRAISPAVRVACETLGRLVSLQLGAFAATALQQRLDAVGPGLETLRAALASGEGEVLARLLAHPVDLTALVGAAGAAVVLGSEVHRCGLCPAEEQVRQIAAATATLADNGLFATRQLAALEPGFATLAETASGVLAVHMPGQGGTLLWFRPEVLQTVNWGGDPRKSAHVSPDLAGVPRLHPRRSFALWKEEVRGRALPWEPAELAAAADLRRTAIEHDLQRQVTLQKAAVKAREDLVAVVSHDLRTPVSIVAMQAMLLQRLADQEAGERSRRLLASVQTIQRSAERMTNLLRDLLDLGKIEAGRFEVAPVPQPAALLVSEACELMQHVGAAKGVGIVHAGAPELPVRADAERIFQVFANLISNAVKFTPAGGTVTVGAAPVAGGCEFFVRDTGTGMPPDQLAHVFDRYWQGRAGLASSSGAGLGLYICKGIVEAHGGRMRVESVPGTGSVFYFTLPTA